MSAFLLLSALIQTQEILGQDSPSKLAVVVSPVLFVPVSVAVQGGLCFRLGNRLGLLTEAAFPTFYPSNTVYEKIRYWRAAVELRYRYRQKASSRRYLALQTSYLHRSLHDADQAFYYTKTQTFSYANAVIRSPVLAAALKTGVELQAGKRIFVDAFLGLGLRFIITSYSTQGSLLTSLEPERQTLLSFDDAWLYNYTLKRLHAAAGLRIGFRL